jgi:hypothetical protein
MVSMVIKCRLTAHLLPSLLLHHFAAARVGGGILAGKGEVAVHGTENLFQTHCVPSPSPPATMSCFLSCSSPAIFMAGGGGMLHLTGVWVGGGEEEGVTCDGCSSVLMHDVWIASCKREGIACVACDVVDVRDGGMVRCGCAAVTLGYVRRAAVTNVHATACASGVLVYDTTAAIDFVSAKGFSMCGIGCFNGATVQVTTRRRDQQQQQQQQLSWSHTAGDRLRLHCQAPR